MKIIIYQADKAVPFSELYKPLGSFNKLFFSNKISQFDESHIKILLPNQLKQDDSTFLVPENWKADFFSLLNNKFGIEPQQKEPNPSKPPKEEIGSGWDDELAWFYDENIIVLERIMESKIDEPSTVHKIPDENLPINHEEKVPQLSLSQIPKEEIFFISKLFIGAVLLVLLIVIAVISSRPSNPVRVQLPDEFQKMQEALKEQQEAFQNLTELLQQKNLPPQPTSNGKPEYYPISPQSFIPPLEPGEYIVVIENLGTNEEYVC